MHPNPAPSPVRLQKVSPTICWDWKKWDVVVSFTRRRRRRRKILHSTAKYEHYICRPQTIFWSVLEILVAQGSLGNRMKQQNEHYHCVNTVTLWKCQMRGEDGDIAWAQWGTATADSPSCRACRRVYRPSATGPSSPTPQGNRHREGQHCPLPQMPEH